MSLSIPKVVITPSTPNFPDMPFDRSTPTCSSSQSSDAEKQAQLHGLRLGFDLSSPALSSKRSRSPTSSSASSSPRSSRSALLPYHHSFSRACDTADRTTRIKRLLTSLTVIALFLLILIGPAVPLKSALAFAVCWVVEALKNFVHWSEAHPNPKDEAIPITKATVETVTLPVRKRSDLNSFRGIRPGFSRSRIYKRQEAISDTSASVEKRVASSKQQLRSALTNEAIAHKMAELSNDDPASYAAVVYTHNAPLAVPSTPVVGESSVEEKGIPEVDESDDDAQKVITPVVKHYNRPAAPNAPWSLANEISAKQKEAGRLAGP